MPKMPKVNECAFGAANFDSGPDLAHRLNNLIQGYSARVKLAAGFAVLGFKISRIP